MITPPHPSATSPRPAPGVTTLTSNQHMPESSLLTPLLSNRSSSRMHITPSHLWRTGALFGSESPLAVCVPTINCPTITSRGRDDYGCIWDPCSSSYTRFLLGQSSHIHDSGSLCGKCQLMCTNVEHLPTICPELDIQWSRFVPRLDAPTLRQAPFRGSGHRRGGLCIFGLHHGCCLSAGSVSALVAGGADHPRFSQRMFSLSKLAPVIPLGAMIAIAGYVHEDCEFGMGHDRYHVF